jgi:hypothetical protein
MNIKFYFLIHSKGREIGISDLEDYLISSSLSSAKVIHGNSSIIIPSTTKYSLSTFSTLQIVVFFVMETRCVFCNVQTKVLSIITDKMYVSMC